MARRIRLDAPHRAHHVMVRGLDGAPIFIDADDCQDFVDRLIRLLPECETRCLAWAIMPNHAHLVLQTDRGELSRVMRRLNTGYAARFNRLHARRGYVFQNRFRSRIATDDADLIGLIRYVHLNPLEAGIVESLDSLARFPWSGHGALIGMRPPFPFEAVGDALALFGDEVRNARARLMAWMSRIEPEVNEPDGEPVAIDPAALYSTIVEPHGRIGLDVLLSAASARYGVSIDELRSRSKQPHITRARAAIAWVAVVELGVSGRLVSAALGVNPSTVSSALARGRRVSHEDGFHAAALEKVAGENLNIPKI